MRWLTDTARQVAREPEELLAAEAPQPALLSLAGAVGNQAFATLAREKTEGVVTIGSITIKAATPEEQDEAKRIVELLTARYGVKLDSANSVAKLKDKYRRKAAPQAGDPTAEFEALLDKSIQREPFLMDELRGLVRALEAPLVEAGTVQVRHLRNLVFGDPNSPVPKAAASAVAEWTFGRTTGTLTDGAPDPFTQAETISAGTASAITLTGEYTTSEVEIPDKDPVAQVRATVVHEVAHTFPGAFVTAFSHKFKQEGGTLAAEKRPTLYAEENVTEDFCDSFMLYTLYPETLKHKCPQRYSFFDSLVGGLDRMLEKALDEAEAKLTPAPAAAGGLTSS